MPDLIRHPVCFFLDSGFRRNDLMRGKPRGIEPEVNKKLELKKSGFFTLMSSKYKFLCFF